MPEYLSVMTFLQCSLDEMLPHYMQQYREVLERLGYADQDVKDLLGQVHWEEDNFGFGYTLDHEVPLQHIQLAGQPLFAKPITAGWTSETYPNLQEPWVAIELACETQTERQNLDTYGDFIRNYDAEWGTYQPGVGHAIWQIMRTFFYTWGEPVWFTWEGSYENAWLALVTGKGNLWDFEAALIPVTLAHHFHAIPEGYSRAELPEGIGLVQRASWATLPWEEGEM